MKRIVTHKRSYSEGYTTIPEHMPERHRAYAESKEYNAAYFQRKAREIGPETLAVVNNILSSALFVQQAYRSCQGLLRLPTRFGKERLENACKMMEPKTAATYKRVKAILENNMDLHPANTDLATHSYIPINENVRGAEAFQ